MRTPTTTSRPNEYLYRRVDIEDVVDAHLCALDRARAIGFGRYIISATTPFVARMLAELRRDAPAARASPRAATGRPVCRARLADAAGDRSRLRQRARARRARVAAAPRLHVGRRALRATGDIRSALARVVGAKGYHA